MQFKTPESALQAQSQESARIAKPYGPSAGSKRAAFAKSPTNSTHVDALGGVAALVDRARSSATVAGSYMRAQPWKAIGIGAAIGVTLGVVLGLVFARRA